LQADLPHLAEALLADLKKVRLYAALLADLKVRLYAGCLA
jgi:hypothetical protein